jgi:NAD(P)-dependent dehydrogenase (short-subunit alcohol dehydrogenase family)
MGRVEQKVAIVTGGASGIGEASARLLAREGAGVVIADINGARAEAIAEEIRQQGGKALGVATDMGDATQIEAMVSTAAEHFGRIDVLFNNAAAMQYFGRDHACADVDLEVWQAQLAVNLTGPMLASKFAIPHMIAAGGGSIIHTSSVQGVRGTDSDTGYATTKSAVFGLSKSIAVQYGKQGIRSNVICPGLVLSPTSKKTLTPEMTQLYVDHHLVPRAAEPEDLANVLLFLASDDSFFITGDEIMVDGGFTAHLSVVPELRRLGVLPNVENADGQ